MSKVIANEVVQQIMVWKVVVGAPVVITNIILWENVNVVPTTTSTSKRYLPASGTKTQRVDRERWMKGCWGGWPTV